jgi:hypothetical protein
MIIPTPTPLGPQSRPFHHTNWLFEIKHDGFRALALIDRGHCWFVSRRKMRDFRKVWKRACREAGLGKQIQDEATGTIRSVYPIPHDFRRSAVRNMVRAG